MSGLEPRRILVVDSSHDFADGLCALLEQSSHLRVVGRASSRAAALTEADRLHPDLIVMDVSLPDGNGFELTREFKRRSPQPLIILVSFHVTRATRTEAQSAGADDCISKAEVPTGLIPTINAALKDSPQPPSAQSSEGESSQESSSPLRTVS